MFFNQFLCLFYLMTLANAYTISKIKKYEDNSESINDNINELDNIERSLKFTKLRKYRREDPAGGTKVEATTKPNNSGIYNNIKRRHRFWRKHKNKHKRTPINNFNSIKENYNFIKMREKRSDTFNNNINSEHGEMILTTVIAPMLKRPVNNEKNDLKLYQKYVNDIIRNLTEHKSYMSNYKENIKDLIEKISNGVTDLIHLRTKDKSTPKNIKAERIDTTQVANVEEGEMVTAETDSFINKIKERAVQIVSENNPSLSNLISNTVTKATFDVDTLVKKITLTAPGVSFNKITVNNTDKIVNENKANTLSPHKIDSRSLKEDGMTVAQTIEDYLQKEYKSLHRKVKNKMRKDCQKKVKYAKSTIKKNALKVSEKMTPRTTTKAIMMKLTKIKDKSTAQSHHRGFTKKLVTTQPTSTVDDFILLTIYEEILAKNSGDNYTKIVTMPYMPFIKKRNVCLVSKRNLETSTDLNLKDNMNKICDKSVDTYIFSTDVNVITPLNDYSDETENQRPAKQMEADISYKVKHQAPQITTVKRNKRMKNKIFDDNDFDDQEVSTKTDDSWFKKHFYMFVDNGPSKKFHTSQTVSLKAPTRGDIATKTNLTTTRKSVEERVVNLNGDQVVNSKEIPKVNLHELSNDLEGMLSVDKTKPKSTIAILNESGIQNLPMIKELQLNIEKLFGKDQRILSTTKKNDKKADDYEENDNLNDDDDEDIESFDMSMINNFNDVRENVYNTNRVRRNLKKHVKLHDNINNRKKSTSIFFKRSENANKIKKYGCVNIDLVPTQIVTLRNKKESRLKKLLNVFHRNKKKIHKRDNQRKQRCSLKKIKQIFHSKRHKSNDKVVSALNNNLHTTKLTGFKPYKFDEVQSLEDMIKQIPNITNDLNDHKKIKETINNNGLKKGLDVANVAKEFSTQTPTITSSKYSKKQKSTSFPITFKDNSINDNILTVKTLSKLTTPEMKAISMRSITDEELKEGIDESRVKVALNNIYNRPHLHKFSIAPVKVNGEINNCFKHPSNEGIIINRKTTRIAKFHLKPKQKSDNIDLVHVLESPNSYEGFHETRKRSKESFNYENGLNIDKINVHKLPRDIDLSNLNNNFKIYLSGKALSVLTSVVPEYNVRETIKSYPDYFNEVLKWNHDILNYDRLPQWHHMIHSDLVTEYSTPNIEEIRRELNYLDEVMNRESRSNDANNDVTKRHTENTTKTNTNDLIRKIAVNDDTKGSGKEIFIKNETKYFKYNKQPVELSGKYINTVDVANKMNNLDFKLGLQKKFPRNDDPFNIMGKYSLKPLDGSMGKFTAVRQITKLNTMPKHYFATPLPMAMNDFEKFLKENNLDVATVTSPLMKLPSINNDLFNEKVEENYVINEDIHKDDSTTVLNKKIQQFEPKSELYEAQEAKLSGTKPKVQKNELNTDLEDLNQLQSELFRDFEKVKVKRDITGHDDIVYGPLEYIDDVKLFEAVNSDQNDSKSNNNISNNTLK